MAARALREFAPAKVNLTLHVLGRRADGFHDLDSLVAFADVGDALAFVPGPALSLTTRGPTATQAGPEADNLVLKAARLLAERVPQLRLGRFTLEKRLPVAAGLGGGSSDAAAALRLIARANRLTLDDSRLVATARLTGADVPVCLDPKPRVMRGTGDVLSAPLKVARLPAVLVNPGVAVPTKDVFAALRLAPGKAHKAAPASDGDVMAAVTHGRNDLEAPAIAMQPVIAEVLSALRSSPRCRLVRMSGSGATCFGLFETGRAAEAAARALRQRQPGWWVRATAFGGKA